MQRQPTFALPTNNISPCPARSLSLVHRARLALTVVRRDWESLERDRLVDSYVCSLADEVIPVEKGVPHFGDSTNPDHGNGYDVLFLRQLEFVTQFFVTQSFNDHVDDVFLISLGRAGGSG